MLPWEAYEALEALYAQGCMSYYNTLTNELLDARIVEFLNVAAENADFEKIVKQIRKNKHHLLCFEHGEQSDGIHELLYPLKAGDGLKDSKQKAVFNAIIHKIVLGFKEPI